MVHPAIVAAIIGAAVVAGVVTYYYIDDHYHNEYEYVQTTRYEHYSDSDSDDEEQGFNARRLLQKAGLRRRRRYQDNNTPDESFSMAARDEKSSMSSASDIEMKRQMLETERQDLRLDEEEARLRRERLRSRGNSILGIMPPTTMEDQMAQAQNVAHDNPFADSHEVPKAEKPELFEAHNSNLANEANSAPLSETSSHHNTLLNTEEDTPYGSILSSTHGDSAQSPLMQPVSPRQDPATEAWRYDDHDFIEANEQDDAMEYESVETSLQLPRARGHSNATVSSSSSWSDIEPSSSQNKSDLSDSDLSIIGRDHSSHDGRSASEDEDGFVDVGGDDHHSS